MSRSMGSALPDSVLGLLDGSELRQREGLTFLLLTNDDKNWPQVAMLSVGEVVAVSPRRLHGGLWPNSSAAVSLSRTGRATLVVVADGNGYYVRATATRAADLDLGSDGRLAHFVLDIDEVREDAADYAKLTSGITFKLKEPDQVVTRWQHTVQALKAAR